MLPDSRDMESYMHVHVAASMPLLTLCYMAHKRVAGIFWTEARKHAKVLVPSNSVNFWTCAACGHTRCTPLHTYFHHYRLKEKALLLCHCQAAWPQHSAGRSELGEQHATGVQCLRFLACKPCIASRLEEAIAFSCR